MKNKFTVQMFASMFSQDSTFYIRTIDDYVFAQRMSKLDFKFDYADYYVKDWEISDTWISVELVSK